MKPEIVVMRAVPDHLPFLAAHMREADRQEVWAYSGVDPLASLETSLAESDVAFSAICDGNPMCIFGAKTVSVLGRVGVGWLLGTDLVETHYRAFARGSLVWRNVMFERYDTLINAVDDRNTLSKRWLQWMGADMSPPRAMGKQGLPFRMFELRRDNV